jgi:hypothetical protein
VSWIVEITKSSLPVEDLETILHSMGCVIARRPTNACVSHLHIDQHVTSEEAFAAAARVRAALRGPGLPDPEFEVGAVVDQSTGQRHYRMESAAGRITLTGHAVMLHIAATASLLPEEREAAQFRQAEAEHTRRLVLMSRNARAAYKRDEAKIVLELLQRPTFDSKAVWGVWESIKACFRGHGEDACRNHFGISLDEFQRFKEAVQKPAVSGEWARHVVGQPPTTANPMSIAEAKEFIRRVAERWLDDVAAN